MHLDVLDLRTFYYRTNLGRAAQKAITAQVLSLWPESSAQTVVGFGFAAPLLRPFLAESRRVIGLMPGPQGVMPWPQGMPNVSVLCEDARWPISAGFVDKLLVMHGLETSENPSAVLDECGRVLGPGGRALFIVPNRSGLWARSDQTPFGFGRPYSLSQLESQLDRHGFVAERHAIALFQPPSHRKFWLRAGSFCENFGQRVSRVAGGVLLLEVSKKIMAGGGEPVRAKRPVVLPVLEGITQPARGGLTRVHSCPADLGSADRSSARAPSHDIRR